MIPRRWGKVWVLENSTRFAQHQWPARRRRFWGTGWPKGDHPRNAAGAEQTTSQSNKLKCRR